MALAIGDGDSPATAFRVHSGLTLRELAKRAGLSPGYLPQIERGVKPGSVAVLTRIASELGTTIDALLVGEESDCG